MKHLRNQGGVTLLEILFALGILVVGTYLVVEGVNQMESSSRQTRLLSSTEKQINAIVDNIRTSLGSYQITYDASDAVTAKLLDPANLPMAWGPNTVMAVKDCAPTKSCPLGRYGFIITPLAGSRGLYTVTLRMTNEEWKGEKFREYKFLATVQ
jgi:type II secretory pathway pseudopilin PulG